MVFLKTLPPHDHITSPINCRNQFARSAIVAKFAEVDALPSAEIEAPFRNGNCQTHSEERGFGMRGHIVKTFHRMVVIGFAFPHEMVHNLAHIRAHIRVGILVDRECARSVLHKEVEQSHLGQRMGQMLHHLTRNKVASTALGRKLKGTLRNHFCKLKQLDADYHLGVTHIVCCA